MILQLIYIAISTMWRWKYRDMFDIHIQMQWKKREKRKKMGES